MHFYGSVLQNNLILKKYIKASMVKLINHLIFFLIYLYFLIINIITNVWIRLYEFIFMKLFSLKY